MVIYDNKDVSVMCPNCGHFLLKADKRDNRKNIIECKHCWKLIEYIPSNPKYGVIKIKPERTCSSGVRFY